MSSHNVTGKVKSKVVARDEWLAARKEHLAKEKEFTRLRDELSAARRELPWVKVEKNYVFDGPNGKESLSDLFAGRQQLIVYHFMYGPDWEEGCPSCSFWADGYDRFIVHLNHRDISLVVVSNSSKQKLDAYRRRMGWSFKWMSSLDNDFNRDYEVSFTSEELDRGEMNYNYRKTSFPSSEGPGISVFYRDDDGNVYHTYSCYSRGLDMLNAAYHHMDLVPKGRDEAELPYSMSWLRRRDEY
jgi:predicted dithiol-disulfide oxidoreductase (DUF899 family)